MFKSKLQELCQRRSWELPKYNTVKDGPDHMPRFTATVNVHGEIFETPAQCKSTKDAQNTAAKIAFDHFNVPPPPRGNRSPSPSSTLAPSPPPPADSSQFQAVSTAPPLPKVPPFVPPPEIEPVAAVSTAPPLPKVPPFVPPPEIEPVAAVSTALSLPTVPPSTPPPEIEPVTAVSSVAPPAEMEPVSKVHSVAPQQEMKTVAGVHPLLPFSPLPASLPTPPPGLLVTKKDVNLKPANGDREQQNHEDTSQTSTVYRIAIGYHDKNYKDTLHMYKNRLQQYAQKHSRGFPVYTSEAEGPPHARRFKSRVSFDGKSYEALEFFPTLKEAEQGAAKVACQVLSVDAIQEDGGLYKNLLQEFAQKKGLLCPSYETISSGMSHKPVFLSTVEIGSHTFRGDEAKTKKQAEMNAAKVAYYALTESCPATESSKVSSFSEYAVVDNMAQNIQAPATTNKHHDTADEESEMRPKRAKSSPENVNVNADLSGALQSNSPSDDSRLLSHKVENSTSAQLLVNQQPIENQPWIHTKTVVMPRKSMMPMPECASVMPYSDEQWVAYKVELQQEPTA